MCMNNSNSNLLKYYCAHRYPRKQFKCQLCLKNNLKSNVDRTEVGTQPLPYTKKKALDSCRAILQDGHCNNTNMKRQWTSLPIKEMYFLNYNFTTILDVFRKANRIKIVTPVTTLIPSKRYHFILVHQNYI